MISGDIMILSVNNITKSFGEKQVLGGISFSAESGKAVGILGRNGAGKTTLIRIIMDVFGADSGEVTLDGNPINKQKIRIGYLPEERGLYPKHKIMEQLVYFASLQGIDKKTAINNANSFHNTNYRIGMIGYHLHKVWKNIKQSYLFVDSHMRHIL